PTALLPCFPTRRSSDLLPALPALGLAALFAFGTSALSVASRGLWQHGPSMLLLAIALYLFVRAGTKPELTAFASIPLALAYAVRDRKSTRLNSSHVAIS